MRKYILSAVLMLLCAVGLQAMTWRSDIYVYLDKVVKDNIVYKLAHTRSSSDKFVMVTGFHGDDSQLPERVEIKSYMEFDGTEYPVKLIRRSAFANCKKKHEFIMPEQLTYVETYAFSNSANSKVDFTTCANGVQISDSVFCGNTIADPYALMNVDYMYAGCLIGVKAEKLVMDPKLLLFGVHVLKDSDIKCIQFSEGERQLGTCTRAFTECRIREVWLNSKTELSKELFYDCPELERIIIPEAYQYVSFENSPGDLDIIFIDDHTIQGIDRVEPESDYIVTKCPALKEIVVKGSVPPRLVMMNSYMEFNGEKNLIDDHSKCVLKVPAGSEELYRAHPIWGKFEHIEGFQPGEYAGIDGVSEDVAAANSVVKAMAGKDGLSVAIADACTVEVYDIMGRLVMRADHQGGVFKADVPSGVYVLRTVK